MRLRSWVFGAVLLSVAPATDATDNAPSSATAPASVEPRTAGVSVRPVSDKDYRRAVLAPHRGRVVLVAFWASYCAPCLEELPALLKLQARLAPRGADVVLVSVDDPREVKAVRAVAAKRRWPAFETFLVTNIEAQPFIDVVDKTWSGEVPYAIVYGRDGVARTRLDGEQPIAAIEAALEAALEATLEEGVHAP